MMKYGITKSEVNAACEITVEVEVPKHNKEYIGTVEAETVERAEEITDLYSFVMLLSWLNK